MTASATVNSTRYASKKDIVFQGVNPKNYLTWTRPPEWLTIPTVTSSEQKFVGLFAVFPGDQNYIAFLFNTSSGTYTVDWGDGSATQDFTANTQANYKYDYDSISQTPTSRGYKQVIVTVTPTTGGASLTSFQLPRQYNVLANIPSGQLRDYTNNWLDINLAGSFTSLSISSGTIPCTLLERTEIAGVSTSSNVTFNSTFSSCFSLQQVIISADTTRVVNISSMFDSCRSLTEAPMFNTINTTNTSSMFINCTRLQSVPLYNTGNVTNMSFMFETCRSLSSVPLFNTSKVTDMQGMLRNMPYMINVPYFDTANVQLMNSFVQNCAQLTSIPQLNTIKVTNMSFMFQSCTALKEIPQLNTSNVTSGGFENMFSLCASITKIPLLDTSKANSFLRFANGCMSLTEVANLNLANATSMAEMFGNCAALISVPDFNTVQNANLVSTFNGCRSLKTAPNINTSNVTTFNSTFNACNSLLEVPNYDTAKAQNMSSMFNATNLQKTPIFNTSNVTNITNFAVDNKSLYTTGNYNLTNCTSIGTPFSGCTNLSESNLTNVKVSISFANLKLSKTAIENICSNNLLSNATSQTLTLTNNPGIDVLSKTGNLTLGSNTIVMANTVGTVANMYAYTANVSTVTGNITTGSFTTFTHATTTSNFQVNTKISFASVGTITGLQAHRIYYIQNRTSSTTFTITDTPGGGDLVTSGGPANNVTMRYENQIAVINSNANVQMTNPNFQTVNSASIVFRKVNLNDAIFKNWTITG